MAIREIQAKTLLARVNWRDAWFGMTDNMNLYRGCQHQCIYCDTRSECYQVDTFNEDVLVKANAPDLLRKELAPRRTKGIIGTGSMNDPYMPLEADFRLTRRAIETIAEFGFGVHITTKSALVTRDIDLLDSIGPLRASVLMTVTTADDDLGRILEPGASLVSERFAALAELAAHGITTGVALMPVLPFIEDNAANISAIITRAAQAGVGYLIHGLGVTMRDRQRLYYYQQLDNSFPGLRQRYENTFGDAYFCSCQHANKLEQLITELCEQHGLAMRACRESEPTQLSLLE
ncbi:MAG: SPL family radical SAM protein [Anaerolineae bacterium]